MHDFSKVLKENEKIIYECRPNPGKGGKSILGIIFIITFMTVIQVVCAISSKAGNSQLSGSDLLIIYLVTFLFDGASIYAFIYNVFLKKEKVSDDFYCITDKRILKYEQKDNKLVSGYIMNYQEIRVNNYKNGYGDLYMGIVLDENNVNLAEIKNLAVNPNPENMPAITFESIQNPYKIAKVVESIRERLNNTNNKNEETE